jgi:ABC-type glycerol-3-phosphate transport system permease component
VKTTWRNLLPRYLALTLFMLLVLVPISGLFMSAFKTDSQVIQGPFSLPTTFNFANFERAWVTGRFNIFFKNSVIVTSVVVTISVFLSTLTGYAFGMLPLPGRKWLFPLILLGYMVPFEAVLIPLYNLMDAIGFMNT